ncbi:UNVERIFIED_CONTAM: hypothetical protein Sradi_2531900 [Sesamum radiatum]|uniref:Uncharacterized protein n=1 Tax=Sesamum radiatum TaxID=300843 RepID=A0AAW2SMZ3_SESRA
MEGDIRERSLPKPPVVDVLGPQAEVATQDPLLPLKKLLRLLKKRPRLWGNLES